MVDEKILKFLHDNELSLVGINLGYHSVSVSVFLQKPGGSLVVGHARKGPNGAEEDLVVAFRDALFEARLLSDFESSIAPEACPES